MRSAPLAAPPEPPPPAKPKLKKLRLALVLIGLTVVAVISTVFGMLMAVASDLPSLENTAEFKAAENSLLYADGPKCKELDPSKCMQIAKLTGNLNRILVKEGEISPYLKNAVIAIEDRRFYQHHGVDYQGIARAVLQDVLRRRASQGGSTITQQFVKNALSAQGNRSVFQKLREAALAYHLERQWSKEKILTQYLNTVYFGNGAYGVESAVRTYFGQENNPQAQTGASGASGAALSQTTTDQPAPGLDVREAQNVTPAQAALLAAMISSPSLYDPIENPQKAFERRNLVLSDMLDQKMISRAQFSEAVHTALPGRREINPPRADSSQPYFTSWLTQQLVDRYGPGLVFGGGLKVKTTIDSEFQAAAEHAVAGRLGGLGPSASVVAIDNKTGAVKAMVGGSDFHARPFNLATNGHRQPGSSIKPFILVRALADGVSPDSTWTSQPKVFPVPGSPHEKFPVRNYANSYVGTASLWSATATSDNSVFAELGLKEGTKRVARMARRMGIRTKLSTNPAMVLGGLKMGVTPLEMAYAYSTIANEGQRRSGTLAPHRDGPVAIERVKGRGIDDKDMPVSHRAFSAEVGKTAKEMLHLVVTSGTGKAAQVGSEYIWGKTGTTENYGDAWFVGGNADLTVAIWVGYPDKVVPMKYLYAGGPVAGGTFPAQIFHDFMASFLQLRDARQPAKKSSNSGSGYAPTTPVNPNSLPPAGQTTPTTPQTPTTPKKAPQAAPQPQTPAQPPAPQTPAPAQPAPPATPPPPSGGTGGGGGVTPNGTG